VIARTGLNIRAMPTTNSAVTGGPIKYGTVIRISCKVVGQNIDGNKFWYKLADARFARGYVSARYVDNIGRAPEYCPRDTAQPPASVGKAPGRKQQDKQGKQESGAPVG
jgi:SH3 domain-containing protein